MGGDGGRGSRRVLAATLFGIFLTSFPSVILVAALPEIADEFGVSESSVGWVLTAPMIAASVLVPLFGRLGDLRGHRRVFLGGFVCSVLAAAAVAGAWGLVPLILLRVVAQAAGSATGPTALALLMATHGPAERPRALGYWALAGASAPVIGILVGAPLIDLVSWRGFFVLQALIGLLALPFTIRALPETPRVPDVRFDVAGGVALMIGSGAAVFAVDRTGEWGVLSPGVLVAAAIAPVALWVFGRIERASEAPLLPLALVADRAYVAPVATEALLQVPSIGAFFIAPLVLHATFDISTLATAYLLIPMPLAMSLAAPLGGRMTMRLGERRTSVVGSAMLAAGMASGFFAVALEVLPLLMLSFVLHGAGSGFTRPSLASGASAALDASTTGVGMAVMRMLSQLGSAVGIAVAVGAIGLSGFGAAYVALGLVTLVAAAAAAGVVDVAPDPEDTALGAAVLPVVEA